MAFHATLDIIASTAHITLTGELDAATAPKFREKIEEVSQLSINRLVLMMQDLSYMASAGLRVLVFARQKMGADIDIYLVGTQENVEDTIKITGFHHSFILLDTYDTNRRES